MMQSKVRRFSTLAVMLCGVALLGESAGPLPADAGLLGISYSSADASPAPSGSMAGLKKLARAACYPVFAQCTKDSDCCTGFCRVGRVTAYCDYK
jgi:hypothetical protein